jgi:hypothetical protein
MYAGKNMGIMTTLKKNLLQKAGRPPLAMIALAALAAPRARHPHRRRPPLRAAAGRTGDDALGCPPRRAPICAHLSIYTRAPQTSMVFLWYGVVKPSQPGGGEPQAGPKPLYRRSCDVTITLAGRGDLDDRRGATLAGQPC